MMDNGQMINNMGMVFKFGLTVVDMKVIMIWEKRAEKENMFGKTEVTMMVIGLIIKLQAKANMSGLMEEDIKVTG